MDEGRGAQEREGGGERAVPDTAPDAASPLATPPSEGGERTTTDTASAFAMPLSEAPADIRDVSFPIALRGYERRAVNAYVERVNRVIAELEISRSPQSAVKNALDRVGEQTSGMMERAREVADELTSTALAQAEHATRRAKIEAAEALESAQARAEQLRAQSQQEADEIIARARAEAAERVKGADEQARALREAEESRLRSLRSDIEAVAKERHRALEELRRSAADIERFAGGILASEPPADAGGQADRPRQGPVGNRGDQPTQPIAKQPAGGPVEDSARAARGRQTPQGAGGDGRR